MGEGVATFRDTVKTFVENRDKKFLLNMAELSYADSLGIQEMVSSFTTIANRGGSLKLLSPTKIVKDLL
jgi:anti-anti-sigma factor